MIIVVEDSGALRNARITIWGAVYRIPPSTPTTVCDQALLHILCSSLQSVAEAEQRYHAGGKADRLNGLYLKVNTMK